MNSARGLSTPHHDIHGRPCTGRGDAGAEVERQSRSRQVLGDRIGIAIFLVGLVGIVAGVLWAGSRLLDSPRNGEASTACEEFVSERIGFDGSYDDVDVVSNDGRYTVHGNLVIDMGGTANQRPFSCTVRLSGDRWLLLEFDLP